LQRFVAAHNIWLIHDIMLETTDGPSMMLLTMQSIFLPFPQEAVALCRRAAARA
jgi:hypothetical protein